MVMADQARRWAEKTFGDAELGDERRTARLVSMAAQVARTPAGTVGQVFTEDAERQGAYDFLESGRTGLGAINDSKDFGAIGDYAHGGRGIKVIGARATTEVAGVPLGLLHQQRSTRPKDKLKISAKKGERGRSTRRRAGDPALGSTRSTARRASRSATRPTLEHRSISRGRLHAVPPRAEGHRAGLHRAEALGPEGRAAPRHAAPKARILGKRRELRARRLGRSKTHGKYRDHERLLHRFDVNTP